MITNTNCVSPSDADYEPDGMILWECKYTATGSIFINKCVDYWYSTTPITIQTIEHFWELINTDYKVTDFSCRVSPTNNGKFQIVEQIKIQFY